MTCCEQTWRKGGWTKIVLRHIFAVLATFPEGQRTSGQKEEQEEAEEEEEEEEDEEKEESDNDDDDDDGGDDGDDGDGDDDDDDDDDHAVDDGDGDDNSNHTGDDGDDDDDHAVDDGKSFGDDDSDDGELFSTERWSTCGQAWILCKKMFSSYTLISSACQSASLKKNEVAPNKPRPRKQVFPFYSIKLF